MKNFKTINEAQTVNQIKASYVSGTKTFLTEI